MKRINSTHASKTSSELKGQGAFNTKNRFTLLINRFKTKRFYYYGCCLVIVISIWQSACKKKETEIVPVVTISGVNKTVLKIGDTLVITGTNFNTEPSKNLVSVASVSYNVIKASATQLSAIVPKGAQGGLLSMGFNQGQSTSFSQLITIVGSTQPFINSISPVSAYEGDTVVIKGGNFGIPYTTNSITFNGSAGKVVNISDSVIRVVVPVLSVSGPVIITTNGLNSLPTQFTVSKVDPNADGHLYWLSLNYGQNDEYNQVQTEALFDKGLTNAALPETATFYDYKQALIPGDNIDFFAYPYFYPLTVTADNFMVNDAQSNAYYLTADNYATPSNYSLMRVNPAGAPTSVWSQNFPAPGTATNYYSTPGGYPVAVNDLPVPQLSIDGNTVYIKIGITDNYYVGDVSASSPALTLQQNVFGDPLAFKPQFGTNYIFYQEMGSSASYDTNPDAIVGIRYMTRGSKSSMPVPITLQPNEKVVSMQADLSHGDNLMIFTTGYDANYFFYNNIYKFNAATKQVTTLYSKANWRDAGSAMASAPTSNSGFFWLGTHIYYSSHAGSSIYNTLYRLNDNGVTPKIYVVYGRLEPNSQGQASQFYFFTGK